MCEFFGTAVVPLVFVLCFQEVAIFKKFASVWVENGVELVERLIRKTVGTRSSCCMRCLKFGGSWRDALVTYLGLGCGERELRCGGGMVGRRVFAVWHRIDLRALLWSRKAFVDDGGT